MTSKNTNESSSEAKFIHDAKLDFTIKAKRNKKFAEWAAKIMHLHGSHIEDYIKDVMAAEFDHKADEAVIKKVYEDIKKFGNNDISLKEVESSFVSFSEEASRESRPSDDKGMQR